MLGDGRKNTRLLEGIVDSKMEESFKDVSPCETFIKEISSMPDSVPVLWYAEVRDIMKKLRAFFPICKACRPQEAVARIESLYGAVLVGDSQYRQLMEALRVAMDLLDFGNGESVDLYVVNSPGANAQSFSLPGEPIQIKINSKLVRLLGLLDPANSDMALMVFLHELAHVRFKQTRYKTAMRIYSTFLEDGTETRAVLSQQAFQAFQRYLVAMELTADLVMFSALTEKLGLEKASKTVQNVFAKLASGVDCGEVNGEAYFQQVKNCHVDLEESMLAAAHPHPPLGLRLKFLLCRENQSLVRQCLDEWQREVRSTKTCAQSVSPLPEPQAAVSEASSSVSEDNKMLCVAFGCLSSQTRVCSYLN